jgi:hypothetical protein
MAKPINPSQFRLNNFYGGINSISEVNTLASFASPQNPDVGCEFQDMENWMPIHRGGLSVAYGFTTFYTDAGADPITGLYRFIQSNGDSYFIYATNSKVYNYNNGSPAEICSVESGAYISFCTAENYLIICDGTNAPRYWDGTNLNTIGNGAPTGAIQAVFAQNRLWLFDASDNLLYFSTAGDITSGYNGLFSYFANGVYGDSRTSGWSLQGVSTSNGTIAGQGVQYYFTVATNGAIDLYQDINGTTLVASGSAPMSLPGTCTLTQQNSSGISGTVIVSAGTAETTVANQYLIYTSNNVTGGFVNCNVGDGQNMTAICPFFIPADIDPLIMVGKTRSVGIIYGSGTLTDPYYYETVNFDFGIAGWRQFVQQGSKMDYLTPQGVAQYDFSYFGVSTAKMVYEYISEKVRNKFTALSTANAYEAHCWHDWKNTRVSFAVAEAGQNYPNVIWHFDYRLQCWYKERYGAGVFITASMIDIDGTWYHGDNNGNIFVHHPSLFDFDGASVNSYFTLPYLDFGAPNTRKQVLEARLTCRGNGSYIGTFSYSLDYGDRNGTPNTITLNTGSYTWGGGVWTSNPATYQWGGNPILTRRFFPTGWFRNIAPTFTHTGVDQPMDIFELDFVIKPMELR